MLAEAIRQTNYIDGNSDETDITNQMAPHRLGAKVELDQFVEAQVAFLHEAEAGDSFPGDNDSNREAIQLDTGHVLLKNFIGQKFQSAHRSTTGSVESTTESRWVHL